MGLFLQLDRCFGNKLVGEATEPRATRSILRLRALRSNVHSGGGSFLRIHRWTPSRPRHRLGCAAAGWRTGISTSGGSEDAFWAGATTRKTNIKRIDWLICVVVKNMHCHVYL